MLDPLLGHAAHVRAGERTVVGHGVGKWQRQHPDEHGKQRRHGHRSGHHAQAHRGHAEARRQKQEKGQDRDEVAVRKHMPRAHVEEVDDGIGHEHHVGRRTPPQRQCQAAEGDGQQRHTQRTHQVDVEVVPVTVADVLEAQPATCDDGVLAGEVAPEVTKVEDHVRRGKHEGEQHGQVDEASCAEAPASRSPNAPHRRGRHAVGLGRHALSAGHELGRAALPATHIPPGHGGRDEEHAQVVLDRRGQPGGHGADHEPAPPAALGGAHQQYQRQQREGRGRHVGDGHV